MLEPSGNTQTCYRQLNHYYIVKSLTHPLSILSVSNRNRSTFDDHIVAI